MRLVQRPAPVERTLVRRVALVLLVLGVHSQVVQALLAREGLVAFYGNEVSLGAFFGGWLLWVAVGAAAALGLERRLPPGRALTVLRSLVLALPALLVLQVLGVRLVRLFLDVSAAELVPLGELLTASLLLTLPTSLALGLAFPLACQARSTRAPQGADGAVGPAIANVSGLYVVEAIGALAGGLIFTFLLVEHAGVWRSVGLTSAALAGVALGLGGGRAWRGGASAVLAAGLVLGVTPLGAAVDGVMERLRFAVLQPGLELLEVTETRYGHVAVARRGSQVSLVTDGRVAASWPDPLAARQEVAYLLAQAGDPQKVLVFGASGGERVAELLRYPVRSVTLIEEDARAFERVRPHLAQGVREALGDPRLAVLFQDGRAFVNGLRGEEAYDLILVLGGDPSTAHSNRYFTREFYAGLARAMSRTGVLCTAVGSASNYLGREVRSYSGAVLRTLQTTFAEVTLVPGDTHVFCAALSPGRVTGDAAELDRRYLAVAPAEERLPAGFFADLLPPARVAFVRDLLESEAAEVNSDTRPVAYYLNMVLWGKLSASGFVDAVETLRRLGYWPYLTLLTVVAALVLVPGALRGAPPERLARGAGTLGLVVAGLIAMAAELTLFFSYQAQVGFIFARIALLNATFMTGLALGAGSVGRVLPRGPRPGLAMAGLLLVTAGALAVLPAGLARMAPMDSAALEWLYVALTLGVGLFTGTAYPLGVALVHREAGTVLTSSGVAQAADYLGGALGGLVTGALLVPLLGTADTLRLLAWAAFVTALPLLAAERAPAPGPLFLARSHRAFPWPVLSWALTAAVLTGLVLTHVDRGSRPGPVTRFGEETLAAVSGSTDLDLRLEPFPHYLGRGPAEGAAATVSLASRAVTDEVRGHGGPLNLLVSVDEAGVLKGVRYVESNETPAYIEGIEAWLAQLAGRDLRRAPLDPSSHDVLTGATVTSRAALETVSRAAVEGARTAFGLALPAGPSRRVGGPGWPALVAVVALLAAFYPVYRAGRDGPRLVYQGASLLVLGVWLNTLPTEVDLVNASWGHLPGLAASPQWYLLAVFVLVSGVLFGQAYCGYVCPFGALQEFLSRAGRYLRLRRYAGRAVDTRLRQLKFILLALVLLAAWASGDLRWATFNPMQHLFGGRTSGWLLVIAGLALAGAVVYYRFWCRYLCPFGAWLALFNKLALAPRLAPVRRLEHCDLGVRHAYDVDCIRCNRCVTARDFGVRPPRVPPRGERAGL